MKEVLSSSLTFAHKFVVTGLWIAGSCMGMLALLLSVYPDVPFFGAHLVLLWILGSALVWFVFARLKRVELDGDTLVISSYRKEIRVPVRDLVEVEQNLRVSMRPVFLTFNHSTPFGRSVMFMPPMSLRLFSEDEVVGRLRKMAGEPR